MDSASSESLHSSSGCDEEYHSRAGLISSFINQTSHVGQISKPPPSGLQPPLHQAAADGSPMFDPLPNYFDFVSWSKTPRSDPDSLIPVLASASSLQSLISNSQSAMGTLSPVTENSTPSAVLKASSSSSSLVTTEQQSHALVSNPRKRSRASRRAPTTVLTTDTTNFRAMVQEFTGIPEPPFSSSSPFSSTRLDLFGTLPTTVPSSVRSDPLDASAQKFQRPPLVSFSSSTSSLSSSFLSCSDKSGSVNYQIHSDTSLPSLQNQILTFQSFLQQPPKNPLPNSSNSGSKPQSSSLEMPSINDSQLKLGDESHLRSINGSCNYSQDVTNGKISTLSGSSSGFHGDKES